MFANMFFMFASLQEVSDLAGFVKCVWWVQTVTKLWDVTLSIKVKKKPVLSRCREEVWFDVFISPNKEWKCVLICRVHYIIFDRIVRDTGISLILDKLWVSRNINRITVHNIINNRTMGCNIIHKNKKEVYIPRLI